MGVRVRISLRASFFKDLIMTNEEILETKRLYIEFRRMYPGVKNPSDINTPEKAYFLILKGFEKIRMMQRARKAGYDFTIL